MGTDDGVLRRFARRGHLSAEDRAAWETQEEERRAQWQAALTRLRALLPTLSAAEAQDKDITAAVELHIEQTQALTAVSYALSEEFVAALAVAGLRLHVRHDVRATAHADGNGVRP